MGKLFVKIYEKRYHRPAPDYVAEYSLWEVLFKPVRKWLVNTVAANSPFNGFRVGIYRMCGFKIGKHSSIGMKCYLDDHCRKLMEIEDDVTISYGVYFACHGKNQPHTPIRIKKGAYVGMRASIVSGKSGVVIGENAVIGACSLVLSDVPDGATAVGVPCRVLQKAEE
jgi:acetyltransferase-like isoleucine patch superfamily enzyme